MFNLLKVVSSTVELNRFQTQEASDFGESTMHLEVNLKTEPAPTCTLTQTIIVVPSIETLLSTLKLLKTLWETIQTLNPEHEPSL